MLMNMADLIWLIENSWGPIGFDNGHLIMTDEWFDEYMFRLVINKNMSR